MCGKNLGMNATLLSIVTGGSEAQSGISLRTLRGVGTKTRTGKKGEHQRPAKSQTNGAYGTPNRATSLPSKSTIQKVTQFGEQPTILSR